MGPTVAAANTDIAIPKNDSIYGHDMLNPVLRGYIYN